MAARQLARRAIRMEWMAIGWMIIEAVGALWAGVHAHSVALSGFGADSLIELLSAGILGVLALYLIGAAMWELLGHLHETTSPLGMSLAAISIGLMIWIA